MSLRWLDPRNLRENPSNPRTISDDRYEALKHSITVDPTMLEARPIVLDAEQQDIVMGNMRHRVICDVLADLDADTPLHRYVAEHDGVPVYEKTFASAAERREWITRDNNEYGEWIPAELAALVAQHQAEGGDMALLGFSDTEADALLALHHGEPERTEPGNPDDVPPAPARAITQPGDVWQLGDHQLVCGDAVDPETYAALDGERAWCMWTDPPYNVGYSPENRTGRGQTWDFGEERRNNPLGEHAGDARRPGAEYGAWLLDAFKLAGDHLHPGGSVYVCHADKMVRWVAQAFEDAEWYFSSQIIWLKTVLTLGRSDYHYKHEPILYGWREGAAHRWLGDRTQTTVYEVANDHYAEGRSEGYVHPTQKPYDLIRPMLENSTERGDVVLDPFAGSGSTLIACEQLGRRCRAIEIEPRYCDVIVSRWGHYAGARAELIVSGDGSDPAERDLEPVWALSTP